MGFKDEHELKDKPLPHSDCSPGPGGCVEVDQVTQAHHAGESGRYWDIDNGCDTIRISADLSDDYITIEQGQPGKEDIVIYGNDVELLLRALTDARDFLLGEEKP